ncbi:MAG TPA: hypothetical protein VGY55_04050 [Pirellulales bacterium]|jgi:hypothetical protein|nr:hypothetical protein [Pirellulales bacterium]
MRKLFFGAFVLAVSLARVARADDQADAKAILDDGIKAHGGESELLKLTRLHCKSKGTWYDGDKQTPCSYETYFDGSDKGRIMSFDEDNKLRRIEVFNGKDVWEKDDDQETETLSGERLKDRQELMYDNWATQLFPLKAEDFHLSILDETEVDGRKAVGILVKHERHEPLKLYFDKETHLLVKVQGKFKNLDDGKEHDEEAVYSDYRDVQETKQPFRCKTFSDKKADTDLHLTEMTPYDKPLDEKLFLKP